MCRVKTIFLPRRGSSVDRAYVTISRVGETLLTRFKSRRKVVGKYFSCAICETWKYVRGLGLKKQDGIGFASPC